MYQETRQLTLDLVAIPSINGTAGEAAVIDYLYHRLSQHTAYISGKMQLFVVPAKDDPLFRPVLIAHLKGNRNAASPHSKKRRGILLFGHVDTVGTTDFGSMEGLAFRPIEWTERVQSGILGPVAQRRAASGKWLFGRGVLDMKSGVAAAVTAFEALASQEPSFDVFFSATPDEESGALGVKTLAAWLEEFTASEGIALRAAMNTDFTTWTQGDGGARHIYLGSIGKLLPAVYVRGVPSHVAEPARGIDPNVILSFITQQISYNELLRDSDEDEVCPYPVSLFQKDDKTSYDVQTAVSATAYYNLFHMTRSPKDQFHAFTNLVCTAVNRAKEQYAHVIETKIPVLTYETLWSQSTSEVRDDVLAYAETLTIHQDLRERCRLLVERLVQKSDITGPCVIVYFANGLVPKVNSGISVASTVRQTLDAYQQTSGESFLIEKYFPYISDLSFLTGSSDWHDETFRANFPSESTSTPAPTLELPTLMVGTYGTGAHQPDECVDMDYTFGHLPRLLMNLSTQLGTVREA